MHAAIVTLFPELFASFLSTSLVGRAISCGLLHVHLEELRRHGLGKHLSVDDTPYGGGSGMVMRVDCVVQAMEAAAAALHATVPLHRILLTPQGTPFAQTVAERFARCEALLLVCGRYEGFDERVRHFVDEEVSLGDFVMTGGEVAAMAVLEACVRLLPGVLGNEASAREESFSDAQGRLLEYPQFTRPHEFRGLAVPEVLRSGDHARIRAWRHERTLERTRERRADLLRRSDEAKS
ncbi:MAG: tRNA (guanosine(37)-N1)-methyltransferase TrmD [Polyangiaceae bacterium]|nr:tRNA (guanosine(37)-N1)-methyltransferase TrmD [Polyangiaceae bacterium]